jgi:hypothetical protein
VRRASSPFLSVCVALGASALVLSATSVLRAQSPPAKPAETTKAPETAKPPEAGKPPETSPQTDATASTQPASPHEEARVRFQRGLELYQEGNFEAALTEFRKAYELAPSYQVRYNIGQVCYQLQDYACALKSFQTYLAEGGQNISTERVQAVQHEVGKLTTRVASLEIVSNVPGVEVFIDDVSIGKTPFASSIVVSAGRRRIYAVKEGCLPVTRIVEVPGSDAMRVPLELREIVPESRAAAAPERVPERRKLPLGMTRLSWVGVGVAGAIAIGAGVTGVVTLEKSDQLKSTRFVGATPPSNVESDSSSVKTFAAATDILAASAVVTLGVTLALTFLRSPAYAPEQPPAVTLHVGPGSASVAGSF